MIILDCQPKGRFLIIFWFVIKLRTDNHIFKMHHAQQQQWNQFKSFLTWLFSSSTEWLFVFISSYITLKWVNKCGKSVLQLNVTQLITLAISLQKDPKPFQPGALQSILQQNIFDLKKTKLVRNFLTGRYLI